jgi:hypothetical protein
MSTVAAVSPVPDALTVIVPGVVVPRTMASALPLKALRVLAVYEVVSVGSPLSTPINSPGPDPHGSRSLGTQDHLRTPEPG